jgi:ubiquinone/menaquinone biosynthesis C-methylase UbiE
VPARMPRLSSPIHIPRIPRLAGDSECACNGPTSARLRLWHGQVDAGLEETRVRRDGSDISEDMLRVARTTDPSGDYRLVPGDDLNQFAASSFNLVLCAFPFDNVRGEMKARIFRDLAKLLAPSGIIANLVSSPEIYTHEWASFTTKDFPENAAARSGDIVRIVTTDHEDRRPVEDILWTDEYYRAVYREAGLEVAQVFEPIAKGDEPYSWVSETKIAPWVIYVLRRAT